MAFFVATLREKYFRQNEGYLGELVRDNKAIVRGWGTGQLEVAVAQGVTFAEGLESLAILSLDQGGRWLIFQAVKAYNEELNRQEQGELQGRIFKYLDQRKLQVIKIVAKDWKPFLLQSTSLNVKGFLDFSALSFKQWLREIASYEVAQLIEEREQAEFIKVLQFFVTIQEPLVQEAHLIVDSCGEFTLQDEAGQDLKASYLASLPPDDLSSISKEDLIMSMLVTLMPQKIVIHLQDQASVPGLEMIKAVFGQRLAMCYGCSHCLVSNRQI